MKKTNTTTTNATTTAAEKIAAKIDALNTAADMTAEQVAAALDAIRADIKAANAERMQAKAEAFAALAVADVSAFWAEYIENGYFSALTIKRNKDEGYLLDEALKAVSFLSIDRAYKAKQEEAKAERLTIAENAAFYRVLSRFAHNLIRAMGKDIGADSALAARQIDFDGVDFSAYSNGALEKQANLVVSYLMPADTVGGVTIRKADTRHLVDIMDAAVRIDYKSATRDGRIKAKNESAVLRELIAIFVMRKHGGNYVITNKTKKANAPEAEAKKNAPKKTETKKAA